MGAAKRRAVGLTTTLAGRVVAVLVALTLVGSSVGECQCPTEATAAACCACCPSPSGPSTATTLRASACSTGCGTADGEATLGESLAKRDSMARTEGVLGVAAPHDRSARLPVTALVEAPPLVLSSHRSILRI